MIEASRAIGLPWRLIFIYFSSFISVTSNRNACGRMLFMCGAYSKRGVCLN